MRDLTWFGDVFVSRSGLSEHSIDRAPPDPDPEACVLGLAGWPFSKLPFPCARTDH